MPSHDLWLFYDATPPWTPTSWPPHESCIMWTCFTWLSLLLHFQPVQWCDHDQAPFMLDTVYQNYDSSICAHKHQDKWVLLPCNQCNQLCDSYKLPRTKQLWNSSTFCTPCSQRMEVVDMGVPCLSAVGSSDFLLVIKRSFHPHHPYTLSSATLVMWSIRGWHEPSRGTIIIKKEECLCMNGLGWPPVTHHDRLKVHTGSE